MILWAVKAIELLSAWAASHWRHVCDSNSMDIQGRVSFLPFFHSHVCNPHIRVNRGQMVIQWAVKAQMVIQYVLGSLHDNKMNLRGAAYSPSEGLPSLPLFLETLFTCWCVRVFACLCVCLFVGVACLFDCLFVRSSYPCLGVLSLGLSLEPWENSFCAQAWGDGFPS